MRTRAFVLLALVIALVQLVTGCSSNQMSIDIESTSETNGGKPFYVVVRGVDQATFVTDNYDSVAAKVFKQPADPSVLRSEVVFPGTSLSLTVKKPEVTPLAVYFLFSTPGNKWKTSYAQPVPSSVKVELEGNQIKE